MDRLPRFMVHCDELGRVLPLLGAVSISDERSVSARLEALEMGMKKMTDAMVRNITVSSALFPPALPASPPTFSTSIPMVTVQPPT